MTDAWSALHHARAVYVLRSAGIEALVIKGPSTADWLYPEGRTSADADLLIAPGELAAATAALTGHGYEEAYAGVHDDEVASHSTVFRDLPLGGREVDLHTTFPGVGRPLWDALWRHRVEATLAGTPVWYVDHAARALLVVLHAARDGAGSSRAVADVRRCVAALPPADWDEVVALAVALDAVPALRAGLELVPESALVLGLLPRGGRRPYGLIRVSGGPLAAKLAELRRAPWRRRLTLLRHEALPSAAFLRATRPVARRGGLWMAVAWFQRLFDIVHRLPAAWRDARRSL